MKKLLALAALGIALSGSTEAIELDPVRVEFTNCPANGLPTAQAVAAGEYLLRVTDEDVFMCKHSASSTCGSGGEKFPAGMAMIIRFPVAVSMSCRSAGATADLILTKVKVR